jgi:2-oxoglutarate dehydrogenase E2 component (dihydrolipoamide succinyltransferase)
MATDIVVPTLGESVTEATIAQWLKKPGEAVALDEPLVELETDKVTLEVNASEAGVLAEVLADEGDNVEVGALLGRIDPDGVAKAAPSEVVPEPATPDPATPEPAAQAAPAPAPGGAAVDILVPTMGESVTEGTVAQWLKKPGDTVAQDEPVVEVETDKVTLEVNAPAAGVLEKILAEEGATVEVGAVLGIVAAGAAAAAAPAPTAGLETRRTVGSIRRRSGAVRRASGYPRPTFSPLSARPRRPRNPCLRLSANWSPTGTSIPR